MKISPVEPFTCWCIALRWYASSLFYRIVLSEYNKSQVGFLLGIILFNTGRNWTKALNV
jgi:hypothetical protein